MLGICGGYQMLATVIDDRHESGAGTVAGLGLLPVRIDFSAEKVLGRPSGTWTGTDVRGYEIHHGVATLTGSAEPFLDGCRVGTVWGTMWHGTFENDEFRRGWLLRVADAVGSSWTPETGAPGFAERRETMIDQLADVIEERLDLDLVLGRKP